jgi:small-conductance mechanosensitive channel
MISASYTVKPISPVRSFNHREITMKKNMGNADRIIRVLVAVVVAVLYFTNQISGTLAAVLGLFAVIFVLTSFMSFCPLYLPFKFSTRKSDA